MEVFFLYSTFIYLYSFPINSLKFDCKTKSFLFGVPLIKNIISKINTIEFYETFNLEKGKKIILFFINYL